MNAKRPTSRKQLRSIIAKLNPPQLRPVLLHFFTHTDDTIKTQLIPLHNAINTINDDRSILQHRIDELEVSESRLRELASIATDRQSLLEDQQKQALEQIKNQQLTIERMKEDTARKDIELEKKLRTIKSENRENARDVQDNWKIEMHKMQDTIRSLEIQMKTTSSLPPATPVLLQPVPAALPPPPPPPPPPALNRNEIEMLVERHVERGLGIVAEALLQNTDRLSKLKHKQHKLKEKQNNQHRVVQAELQALLNDINSLKLDMTDVMATTSVTSATLKADIETLHDDIRSINRKDSDAYTIKKYVQKKIKTFEGIISKRINILGDHQVRLGKALANCMKEEVYK